MLWVLALLVGCGPLDGGSGLQGSGTEEAFPGRSGQLRQGYLLGPDGPVRVAWEEIDGHRVLEGDILLREDQVLPIDEAQDDLAVLRAALAVRPTQNLWPGGVVPYRIDSGLSSPSRVTSAIAHWEQYTPLRFVQRTSEAAFVTFRTGTGCWSTVGRTGSEQFVNLSSTCSVGSVMHEIGHAIGLYHENARADRDANVKVYWANIEANKEGNFQTYLEGGYGGADLGPYDYGSLMHYDSYSFSANGQPTLTKLDGSIIQGNRAGLSPDDIAGVGTLYGGGGDQTAPVVSITAPAANATVSGTVTLSASASDNVGVVRVTFRVDGTVVGTRTQSPWTYSWNSTSVADGLHSLTARAEDAAGNATTSAAVSIRVENADEVPPQVSITSPSEGAQLTGVASVVVAASDDVAVARVELFADGALLSSRTAPPWTFTWDTSPLPEGPVVLQARAYDAQGNEALSALRTVGIDHPGTVDPPVEPPVDSRTGAASSPLPPEALTAPETTSPEGARLEPEALPNIVGTCAAGAGGMALPVCLLLPVVLVRRRRPRGSANASEA